METVMSDTITDLIATPENARKWAIQSRYQGFYNDAKRFGALADALEAAEAALRSLAPVQELVCRFSCGERKGWHSDECKTIQASYSAALAEPSPAEEASE